MWNATASAMDGSRTVGPFLLAHGFPACGPLGLPAGQEHPLQPAGAMLVAVLPGLPDAPEQLLRPLAGPLELTSLLLLERPQRVFRGPRTVEDARPLLAGRGATAAEDAPA